MSSYIRKNLPKFTVGVEHTSPAKKSGFKKHRPFSRAVLSGDPSADPICASRLVSSACTVTVDNSRHHQP